MKQKRKKACEVWANVQTRLDQLCMRSRLFKRGVKNTKHTRKQWETSVLKCVRATKPSFLKSLVKSLPTRVQTCIRKKGGPTRW